MEQIKKICVIANKSLSESFINYKQMAVVLNECFYTEVRPNAVTLTQGSKFKHLKATYLIEQSHFVKPMKTSKLMDYAIHYLGEDLIKKTDTNEAVVFTYQKKGCVFVYILLFYELVKYLHGYLETGYFCKKVFRKINVTDVYF